MSSLICSWLFALDWWICLFCLCWAWHWVNSISVILHGSANYRWRKTPDTQLSVRNQSSFSVEPSTFRKSAMRGKSVSSMEWMKENNNSHMETLCLFKCYHTYYPPLIPSFDTNTFWGILEHDHNTVYSLPNILYIGNDINFYI